MIPVPPLTDDNKPPHFDLNCKDCGGLWLAAHPDEDPHDKSEWWRQYKPHVAEHFSFRCGWLAIRIGLQGDVDHYLACGNTKFGVSANRDKAFQWSNFRYSSGAINSKKSSLDEAVLDPCEIEPGWFEVLLEGFLLVTTDAIKAATAEQQIRAKLTLDKLELFNGFHARWARWDVYRGYWNGGNPRMVELHADAPLVAAAVEKAIALGHELPDPAGCMPGFNIAPRKRAYAPRRKKKAQP